MIRTATRGVFAIALVMLAAGCGRDQNQEYGAANESNQNQQYGAADDARTPPGAVTGTTGVDAHGGTLRVADIVADPSKYMGQTVTIEADVDQVFGPKAFAVDEDAPLAGGIDRDLLVVGRNTANLQEMNDQWLNNKVRVTGTVGRVSVVEVEREVGWDLDPQIEAELEGAGAILIAESVTRTQQ